MKLTRDIVELALLRRIAKALEESNRLELQRMEYDYPAVYLAERRKRDRRQRTVITRKENGENATTNKGVRGENEDLDVDVDTFGGH